MQFNPYIPPGISHPVKYYAVGNKEVSIGKKAGRGLCVIAPDEFTEKRVNELLLAKGINLSLLSLTELLPLLQEGGFIAPSRKVGWKSAKVVVSHPTYANHNARAGYGENYLAKSSSDLIMESKRLEIEKAPFKPSTINNVSVFVSSNEPQELLHQIQRSKLSHVESAHLEVADIMIIDNKTGDTLYVERKTVQDLYGSVINHAHSHDQSERMFDACQKLRSEGKRARAIWIVEAQEGGKHLLDNALPEMKQISGLVNYFDIINDQSVHQSYSIQHTAYLVAKYAQGWVEQKLFYPVETSNPSVNRSGKDRLAAKHTVAPFEVKDSGVKRHTSRDIVNMLSYIPSINTKVAKSLADTGRTFSEVTQMSLAELCSVDGVGKKTAERIYEDFNAKR